MITITYSRMFTAVKGSILLSARSRYLVAFRKTWLSKSTAAPLLLLLRPVKMLQNTRHRDAEICFQELAMSKRNLFSRISHVGEDRDQTLDQWVAEGRKISERISNKAFTFSLGGRAVHLDLIGVVRGSEAAERYFDNLSEQKKDEKTHGALLNSYVREGLLKKTLLHMEKMKHKVYASSSLAYNNLKALYKKAGELEKIPEVLSEMKTNGVAPNNFSYRICITSFGERSDLVSMGKLLEEIESQPYISIDWATYSIGSYQFIKANDKEKALTYMKKLEEKIHGDAMGYNNLSSLYAHLEDKD